MGALEAVAAGLRRAMLRTSRGPLAGLWSAAYRLSARCLAWYLRRGNSDSVAYLRGSVAVDDVLYGVSDIDLVLVTAPRPGRPGAARLSIRRRLDRLCAIVPPLRELVSVAIYEDPGLARAVAGAPCLCPPASSAAGSGASPPRADPAELAIRPGLAGPLRDWRRLAGGDRRPATPVLDAERLRVSAWLEIQHWWRYALEACANPPGPRRPYLCFKLVSEPVRVLLWLTEGELFADRRAALHRAIERFPEEREALRFALDLHAELPRSPSPPLGEALAHLVRLTSLVAAELTRQVEPAGATAVELVGGDDEVVIGPRAGNPLRALLGEEPALRPLVDWRALVRPEAPDETFAAVPGSPADPAALGAAAVAGRGGPYPALSADGLLVLATAAVPGRTRLRAVQCPLTDPVSFALLRGRDEASFPDSAGWSVRDTAVRAVDAHRAALPAAGAAAGLEAMATLFTAARAGLLLESVEAGAPRLPLTVVAVAGELGARAPTAGVARTAYETYAEARASGTDPDPDAVAALRERVLALPAYATSVAGPAPLGARRRPSRRVPVPKGRQEQARDRAGQRGRGL